MLTEKQVNFLKKWLSNFRRFFSLHELKQMKLTFQHKIKNQKNSKGFYSGILTQHLNLWNKDSFFKNLVFNKRISRIAKELLETKNIRILQDHALIKKSIVGKATPWHQDFSYFPINEPEALTVWIPFQDVYEKNGCMSYLPTSNTLGRLTKVHMYNIDKPLEDINISPAIAKLKAGSIVIHHSLTLHYAYSNISDNDRLAYAIVYMKDEVTYNGNRHPLIDKNLFAKNQKLEGTNFPIIEESVTLT